MASATTIDRPRAHGGKNTIQIIRSPILDDLPRLVHGFSTRIGGYSEAYGGRQLNLGFTTSDDRQTVERNRSVFFRELLADERPLLQVIGLRQIHSGLVHIIKRKDALPTTALKGDGIITSHRNALLTIQVADCVPVLVADARQGCLGAFHAGWRGTVKRIVERGVGSMRAVFGSRKKDLYAAIGPCVHACCYAVGDEVVDEFLSQFSYADTLFSEVYDRDPIREKYPLLFLTARAPGHSNIGPQIHLDLVKANRRQLLDAGLHEDRIWAAAECTSCRTDLLFSHRAEAGYTGRMMGAVGFLSFRTK